MPTTPHDARILIAGAKLLQIDDDLRGLVDMLKLDYADFSRDVQTIRVRLAQLLERFRRESLSGESEAED